MAKIFEIGHEMASLATLYCCTTSLTTAKLRHMHYHIVCDATNRTVLIMSSEWMI